MAVRNTFGLATRDTGWGQDLLGFEDDVSFELWARAMMRSILDPSEFGRSFFRSANETERTRRDETWDSLEDSLNLRVRSYESESTGVLDTSVFLG